VIENQMSEVGTKRSEDGGQKSEASVRRMPDQRSGDGMQ